MEHREEMIIDGILCYRDDKNNPFIPFTKEELTQKIVDLEQRLESQYNNWCEDADRLDKTREIVKQGLRNYIMIRIIEQQLAYSVRQWYSRDKEYWKNE